MHVHVYKHKPTFHHTYFFYLFRRDRYTVNIKQKCHKTMDEERAGILKCYIYKFKQQIDLSSVNEAYPCVRRRLLALVHADCTLQLVHLDPKIQFEVPSLPEIKRLVFCSFFCACVVLSINPAYNDIVEILHSAVWFEVFSYKLALDSVVNDHTKTYTQCICCVNSIVKMYS